MHLTAITAKVCVKLCLLARDAQANLALIVAQIYPSAHPSVCPSVHLCVCRRHLESMELSIAANFAARRLPAFFPKLVQGTYVWYIFD